MPTGESSFLLSYLQVGLFGLLLVALLFVDDCQVEESSGILLLIDGYLQVVDGLLVVLLLLEVEHSNVKVRFEIL